MDRFQTQRTALLAARLALRPSRDFGREELIDLLWPDADITAGRNRLKQALASLRRQLEPPGVPHGSVIAACHAHIRAESRSISTDVAEFDAALREAAAADLTNRAEALRRAILVYEGEFLPGYYDDWVMTERDRLSAAYIEALRDLSHVLRLTGDLDGAAAVAEQAHAADPLSEDACADLMRIHTERGEPDDAVRHFEAFRARYERDLDAPVPEALAELAAEIRRAAAPVLAAVAVRGSAPPSTYDGGGEWDGPVTFLFTDIEGSTLLWERAGDVFGRALQTHHELLRRCFNAWRGQEAKETGDGFAVAFRSTLDAVNAAVAGQRAMAETRWPSPIAEIRVRMAIHTGEAQVVGGEYHGLTLHKAARIVAAARGGQILLSDTASGLVRDALPSGVHLADLGAYRLRDIARPERLAMVHYPDMPSFASAPPRAEPGVLGSVPAPLTRFFGREAELAHLVEAARPGDGSDPTRRRLITLVGPGGAGKTRLATEAALQLRDTYNGAVWLVPLEHVNEAQSVPRTVADTMRLPVVSGEDAVTQVTGAIGHQPCLVVLDNAEHLLHNGAAADGAHSLSDFVVRLLTSCHSAVCIVTSRRRLDVNGESEMPVPPLPVPIDGGRLDRLEPTEAITWPSVCLFVDRAQAVRPDFQLTTSNTASVAALCERLEGLPLSIELAAAKAQVMTPRSMLEQLEEPLDFLVGRRRDVGTRQRSLRDAVEWSYRLLCAEDQRRYSALSVFRGGWTAAAAADVLGIPLLSVLDTLEELRSSSLVHVEEQREDMRFGMLEVLREFAQHKLEEMGESDAVRDRHLACCVDEARNSTRDPVSTMSASSEPCMLANMANCRAALDWVQASPNAERISQGMRLALCLTGCWFWRGMLREGRRRIGALLGMPSTDCDPRLRVRLVLSDAQMAWQEGQYAEAQALAAEAREVVETYSSPSLEAEYYSVMARVTEAEDVHGVDGWAEKALAAARRTDNIRLQIGALVDIGERARLRGDLDRSEATYREALELARAADRPDGIAICVFNLGSVALRRGDTRTATELHREALQRQVDTGGVWLAPLSLSACACIAAAEGAHRRAAVLLGAAESLTAQTGHVVHPGDRRDVAECIEAVEAALSPNELRSAWNEGRAAGYEQAIALALADS